MSSQPADRAEQTSPGTATTSPYGPQDGHVDDAAGGADSSALENLSSEERAAALRRARDSALNHRASGQP